MSDHVDAEGGEATSVMPERMESVEAYETEEGTVLYDADNPLAWIESSQTVPLDEAS